MSVLLQTWSKKITVKANNYGLTTSIYIDNKSGDYKCLIHIDRLSITFRHLKSSTFQNIKNPDYITNEQTFNRIVLRHDNSPGKGAYYHSFIVYYDGCIIGRLFSGSKMNKPDLQFDFKKELFYSIKPDYWYEAYLTLKTELGLTYNNISYVEIAVDTNKDVVSQFGLLFKNSINNNLRIRVGNIRCERILW